jgi:hypothetical protein
MRLSYCACYGVEYARFQVVNLTPDEEWSMGSPSPSTLKAVGAVSGNVCAFPGCVAPVYDTVHDKLLGKVCHIEANSENGPRYRKEQAEHERQGFANLMFMCPEHHDIVDDPDKVSEYTVEVLKGYKREHETRSHNTVMSEGFLVQLVLKVLEELPGQTTPAKRSTAVTPIIESHRTSTDHHGIDYYCFRVSLRNDGQKTVRNFRLEVEIPSKYADPTHESSMRERRQVRGGHDRLYAHRSAFWRLRVVSKKHVGPGDEHQLPDAP